MTFDNTHWRHTAVGLVLLFFEALLDPAILTQDNLIVLRALLPTHLRAISTCFEEYLVQSSDEGRLGLLGRLQRVRLTLPAWPGRSLRYGLADIQYCRGRSWIASSPSRPPQWPSLSPLDRYVAV